MVKPMCSSRNRGFQARRAIALKSYFADWVEVLRAGIGRNMAEPSADVKIYKCKDGGERSAPRIFIAADWR